MLVIAIFAVASMLSAFSAASGTATPRSFQLVITDDVSQNALSVFIGAFIFSIVSTVALKNGYYGTAGHFILFVLTLFLFGAVILTFFRWVDRISRLGRLEHTIKRVEEATAKSLRSRIENPLLGGVAWQAATAPGTAIYASSIGYVEFINVEDLQTLAEDLSTTIRLNCLPGSFVHLNSPLAYLELKGEAEKEATQERIRKAITIGASRNFVSDPRFGLIALSEIASRALSPGINDPGTAIQVMGSHIRLFSLWPTADNATAETAVRFDRVQVPEMVIDDLFEDAFRPIARDGADNIEVMLHLQKSLAAIAAIDRVDLKAAARRQARAAFARAEQAIDFPADLEQLRAAARWAE
jgi:uncharacterized membrane protein